MKIDWKSLAIIDVASIVSKHFARHQIDAVVVGGACVSIYSYNKYLSSDIDYVSHESLKHIEEALEAIGFVRTQGRLFKHANCDFLLDFVAPPVAIGQEPVSVFNAVQGITLLMPTDCVKDRLSAYFHWDDRQSLEQAVMVARDQRKNIDLKAIELWARKEGHVGEFLKFMESVGDMV